MQKREYIEARTRSYFIDKLKMHGTTPKGVDYNGPDAQNIRFAQLVRIIDSAKPFSLIDYGCGYGALYDFIVKKGLPAEYHGVDIVEEMVLSGRRLHADAPNARFTTDESELPTADYVVACAILNIKLETSTLMSNTARIVAVT